MRDEAGKLLAANDDWMIGVQNSKLPISGWLRQVRSNPRCLFYFNPANIRQFFAASVAARALAWWSFTTLNGDKPANAVNISSRGQVQTGDNVMIGEFIVGGTGTQRVIVRNRTVINYKGIAGALQDPKLELHD